MCGKRAWLSDNSSVSRFVSRFHLCFFGCFFGFFKSLFCNSLRCFNFALTKPGKWFRGTIFKNCKMMKKTNRKGELINERVNIDSNL